MDESNGKALEFNLTDHDRQDDLDLNNEKRVGDLCPVCAMGSLDFDGMLNLRCDKCGFSLAGCFT